MSEQLASMAYQQAVKTQMEFERLKGELNPEAMPTPDQWNRLVKTIARLSKDTADLTQKVSTFELKIARLEGRMETNESASINLNVDNSETTQIDKVEASDVDIAGGNVTKDGNKK